MNWRKAALAILVLVIFLPLLAVSVFLLTFDPNRYAPQLVAAVSRATGRQLVLGDPIHVKLSLNPTIEANAMSLANPPGFADANLLTLDRLEAKFSLLPLLARHLNITNLVLIRPNLILEKNANGQADWNLSPAAAGQRAPAAAPVTRKHGYKVTLESVEVQNGLLTVKGAKPGQVETFALGQLTGTAASGTSPLNIKAQAAYNGAPFAVAGSVGPVARFFGVGSGLWPVDLAINAKGAAATVRGGISEPAAGQGYDVTVNAAVPALEALAPLLPQGRIGGIALPALHGVTASARIVDQNSAIPAIDDLSIKAGASDLSNLWPGLALTALDVEMASLDQPLRITAFGADGGLALSAAGQFGAVQSLFNPALLPASMPPQGSFPVAVQAQAGNAKLGITGAIATPGQLAGVALAVTAAIPDLSALSGAANTPLPAWKNIQMQTTLIDPGGLGLAKAVGIDSLVLTMDNAALGGAASLYFGAQPRLQAALDVRQIDLDAVLAAVPPASAAPPLTPALEMAPAMAAADLVIPARKLPLDLLKSASADIQLDADSLVFNHSTYTALQGHAVLAGGVLTLSPVTGELPGGSVSASASLDAAKTPARGTLIVDAPALALAPLLKAAGLSDIAQGTVQARVNVAGAGDSLHDMAAAMNGQFGLAMVNGIVDGSVLDQLFGAALSTVGLPASLVGAQGPVAVRCFALAVDASNGVGTVRALTLDSNRLLIQGGGTVNFGPETLAVVLRPQLQIAGNPVGVPVQIGGTFAHPIDKVAAADILQSAQSAATGLASALANRVESGSSIFGNVAAAIGLGGPSDVCPNALSLGRLGHPGPAAAPVSAAAAGAQQAPANSGPKSLLDSLFK